MSRVLMIIAPEVFRDEEYAEPRRVLESRNHDVVTASSRPGLCTGKLGLVATADISLQDAAGEPWDAVVYVGGSGSSVFFDDLTAHQLARQTVARGAVLSAICIAPSTIARAGLLDGVHATAFASQMEDLVAHGALWTGDDVTVDGRIVTANGPAAAVEFGNAIADLLD